MALDRQRYNQEMDEYRATTEWLQRMRAYEQQAQQERLATTTTTTTPLQACPRNTKACSKPTKKSTTTMSTLTPSSVSIVSHESSGFVHSFFTNNNRVDSPTNIVPFSFYGNAEWFTQAASQEWEPNQVVHAAAALVEEPLHDKNDSVPLPLVAEPNLDIDWSTPCTIPALSQKLGEDCQDLFIRAML